MINKDRIVESIIITVKFTLDRSEVDSESTPECKPRVYYKTHSLTYIIHLLSRTLTSNSLLITGIIYKDRSYQQSILTTLCYVYVILHISVIVLPRLIAATISLISHIDKISKISIWY
jgi:hypothetical protein